MLTVDTAFAVFLMRRTLPRSGVEAIIDMSLPEIAPDGIFFRSSVSKFSDNNTSPQCAALERTITKTIMKKENRVIQRAPESDTTAESAGFHNSLKFSVFSFQ